MLQWIRIFGAPERIYDDLGTFAELMEQESTTERNYRASWQDVSGGACKDPTRRCLS